MDAARLRRVCLDLRPQAAHQQDVIVAQYAELLRHSPWAGSTNIYELREHALRLGDLLPDDPDVAEFVTLVSRAARIEALTER